MKRDIYKELVNWKIDKGKRPLLVRGARQIGKSYIVEEFGKKEFASYVLINFERNPEYKEIFTSNNPVKLVENIFLLTGKNIVPGKTLLFIDEIQECPVAILSLRYFYEELPDLHVIAAGSLLEFALHSSDFRMPVGRIQYLYMKPLSFGEFLDANNENRLRSYIGDEGNLTNMPEVLHNKLIDLVKLYSILGGMPAVVNEYITSGNLQKCKEIQNSIIETFIDDFAKYSKVSKIPTLKIVFNAVPAMIGRKFVYARVDDTIKSRDLKEAVSLLEQAGIIYKAKPSNGSGLPIAANAKENYFKLIFLDVGLVHALSGLTSELITEKDYTDVYKGAIAEQFVGQELLAYSNCHVKAQLYYWVREARGSGAEVDYLAVFGSDITPIEVKSGSKGRAKSLKMYIEKYKPINAYKISQARFNNDDQIIDFPLYAIEHMY